MLRKRRLEALEPYRDALDEHRPTGPSRDPLAATALNRETVNSMRFMLEAADIDSDGPVGAVKLQGLAMAWGRVLEAWRVDRTGEHSHRAGRRSTARWRAAKAHVDRVEDFARVTRAVPPLAHRLFDGFRHRSGRGRERHDDEHEHERHDEHEHGRGHPHASA